MSSACRTRRRLTVVVIAPVIDKAHIGGLLLLNLCVLVHIVLLLLVHFRLVLEHHAVFRGDKILVHELLLMLV